MAEKDTQIRQIASQLQTKFAAYLRDPSKREGLTAAERRVLDAVRSNPSPGQLQSLYNMTKFSNTNVMVRERAFGSLATALGMEAPEARSLWQRLSPTATADLPGPAQVTTSRVPGEGSQRGGDQAQFAGANVPRSGIVDALLPAMNDAFVSWWRGGGGVGEDDTRLSFEDQRTLAQALADPTQPDLSVLQRFSKIPDPNAFLQTARDLTRDIQISGIEARQTVQQAAQAAATRLNPYYDPSTSSVVFMTRSQAQQRGLAPATAQQQAETDRKASQGAEPPEGYEWSYDPVESKPVLVPIGTEMPARVAGSPDPQDDTGGGTGGGDVPGAGGVPGAGIPGMETAEPMVPPDWETAAAEMYPEYYAIVKNNPEIADLLRRSLGPPEWSEQKFQAELRGTNWWKTTTASARTWDAASALDPATYQAQIDEAATAINQEALNLGIRLSSDKVQKLALDSLRFGWGTQTITNSIGMAATEGGAAGVTQLREGYYGQQVRNTAKQYGVSLNDTTFNSFVNKIAVGEETIGSFQDYALTIAKSLYPPLAEQFDAGRTFEDVTSSYKTIAANLLEKDEASIDMTRPEWVQAVTYQADPKTGEQRLMNMREWQDYLRTTDSFGYQYTTEARSRAYGIADTIANMFGRI